MQLSGSPCPCSRPSASTRSSPPRSLPGCRCTHRTADPPAGGRTTGMNHTLNCRSRCRWALRGRRDRFSQVSTKQQVHARFASNRNRNQRTPGLHIDRQQRQAGAEERCPRGASHSSAVCTGWRASAARLLTRLDSGPVTVQNVCGPGQPCHHCSCTPHGCNSEGACANSSRARPHPGSVGQWTASTAILTYSDNTSGVGLRHRTEL